MVYALTKVKKFGFLYKSIGKFGVCLKIEPKTHFDQIDFANDREWQILSKYKKSYGGGGTLHLST